MRRFSGYAETTEGAMPYQAAIEIDRVPFESLALLENECRNNREFKVLGYRRVERSNQPCLIVGHARKEYLEAFLRKYHRKDPHECVNDLISLTNS